MRFRLAIFSILLCLSAFAFSQTADELVQKNIAAKGGLDKIKAIKSVRMTGQGSNGGFKFSIGQQSMRPGMVKQSFSIQGMTATQAYDGNAGWQIQPFGGHKDPELMGEDDLHDLSFVSDLEGPLVDYQAKGNKVEYLGHDMVDGDDALRLKVTLKNGDIAYYYLDPDTFVEIRVETQYFVRGSVRENTTDFGSYKPVAGVMFPYSISSGPKNDPGSWQNIAVEKIEVNVPLAESDFAVPASLKKDAAKK